MTKTAPRWETDEAAELSPEAMQKLMDNQIPAIRIKDFASGAECELFAGRVTQREMKSYSPAAEARGPANVGYLGISQAEYRRGPADRKREYFEAVAADQSGLEELFDEEFDPLGRLLDLLSPCLRNGMTTAVETGLGAYPKCTVRNISGGAHLHADFAPLNSPGWEIGKIDVQLTANFYASVTESGGETTVFNQPWDPDVTADPRADHLQRGLPPEPSSDTQRYVIVPRTGDVVLFNPRNPHRIASGAGEQSSRISLSFFMGRREDGSVIHWGS